VIGAVRLARLNSPWARRRYRKNPKKLARAERREARLDQRWIAWRNAFFDRIAGKPHLPSLQPLGPDGGPSTAADEASAGEAGEGVDAAAAEAGEEDGVQAAGENGGAAAGPSTGRDETEARAKE
jgi:lysyl-tRNA synthetase class 2